MRGTRNIALLLLLASALCVAVLQIVDPGVGLLEQPLSAHALGRFGGLWASAAIAAGVAMLLQGFRWLQSARRRAGPITLAVSGLAFVLVGVFSTDPWYPWQHALTWTGWIHVGATFVAMSGLGVSMLFDLFGPDRSTRRDVRCVAVLYVVALLLTGCATLVFLILRRDPPLIGLEERVLLILALGWLALK